MKQLSPLFLAMATIFCVASANAQDANTLQFGPQKETLGQRLDGVAVVVGNDVITYHELNALGSRAELEQLILRKLLLQKAKERNITIGDTAVNIAVDEQQKKGSIVSREQLREVLMIRKLQQQVASSLVQISEQEVANIVEVQLQNIDEHIHLIDILVRVPEGADTATLQATENKIQNILQELKVRDAQSVASEFGVVFNDLGWVPFSKVPTKFSTALIDAKVGEFIDPIVDPDGIHLLKISERRSNTNRSINTATETRVSHILIKNKDNPKAKETIESVYAQLVGGADFVKVATQYSQDLGSAVKGGSLDWAYPGQMVPEFEAVMNKTGVGKISAPFKSPFGYHILKVHERRQNAGNNRKNLEQAARKEIFTKKAKEEWELWLSRLREEAHVEIFAK